MSYDPPPYQPPPQGRWPQATPPVPWPSYQEGDVYQHQLAYQRSSAGYDRPEGQYPSQAYGHDGYGSVTDSFDGARNDVITPVGHPFPGPAGYPYPGRTGYPEPAPFAPRPSQPPPSRPSSSQSPPSRPSSSWPAPSWSPPSRSAEAPLTAPDAGLRQDRWQAEQDRRRASSQRGLAVGAWTGLLAVEVAIGVSTLAAAFVRPQAAPVIAGGDVFTSRVPAGLRQAAMTHFGSHGRIALLVIMYLAIACVALGMGVLSRRAAALGVVSLAAFTLLGAFVAITRPGGQPADVIPAVVGGLAGVAALLWLQRASAPVAAAAPVASVPPGRRGDSPRSR